MYNPDHKKKVQSLSSFGICWEANLNILARKLDEMLRVILTFLLVPSLKVCVNLPAGESFVFYTSKSDSFSCELVMITPMTRTCREFEGTFFPLFGP